MHRFYVPPSEARGDMVSLGHRESHHALQVLRLRDGEQIAVLDGAGQELRCEVNGRARDRVSLRVLERKTARAPLCEIILVQAIPKGKLIESIIQKAAELGVTRIVPLLSERVVIHLDSESAEAKAEKWQAVAIEAIKQCGNAWLPKVETPVALSAFLAHKTPSELSMIGCLESGSRHPRACFDEFFACHRRLPKSLAVWIGPEGDFTAAEYRAIQSAGALPITLGSLVLRVDTAAAYVLSVTNYELQAR